MIGGAATHSAGHWLGGRHRRHRSLSAGPFLRSSSVDTTAFLGVGVTEMRIIARPVCPCSVVSRKAKPSGKSSSTRRVGGGLSVALVLKVRPVYGLSAITGSIFSGWRWTSSGGRCRASASVLRLFDPLPLRAVRRRGGGSLPEDCDGAVLDSKSDDPSLDRDTFYKQRRGRIWRLAAIVACCVLFCVICIAPDVRSQPIGMSRSSFRTAGRRHGCRGGCCDGRLVLRGSPHDPSPGSGSAAP